MKNLSKLTLEDGSVPFDIRMNQVKDSRALAKINIRILRLARGNAGDHKQLAENLWELRIDTGKGWRVYYSQQNNKTILLLLAGNKPQQTKDIIQVKEWLDELK